MSALAWLLADAAGVVEREAWNPRTEECFFGCARTAAVGHLGVLANPLAFTGVAAGSAAHLAFVPHL
jgi:hypothetical protein